MNDIERAIETLKMENELMQFDPMTGEIEPIELQNQDNQDLYNANLVAIEALTRQLVDKSCKTMDSSRKLSKKSLIDLYNIIDSMIGHL